MNTVEGSISKILQNILNNKENYGRMKKIMENNNIDMAKLVNDALGKFK